MPVNEGGTIGAVDVPIVMMPDEGGVDVREAVDDLWDEIVGEVEDETEVGDVEGEKLVVDGGIVLVRLTEWPALKVNVDVEVSEFAPGQTYVWLFCWLMSFRFCNTDCAFGVYSIKDNVVQLANGFPAGK